MAAAIVLIPEMLSGPESRAPAASNTETVAEGTTKTYSIDLSDAGSDEMPGEEQPIASNESSAAELPAQQAEEVLGRAPSAQPPANESSAAAAPTRTAPADPHRATPELRTTPVPPSEPERTATTRPAPAPVVSAPSAPTMKGWAVQLGSFSKRETAEELATQFRAERFDTFVMPVRTGSSTLYRVRIGPVQERASAEDTLRRVKAKVPGAAVVAHP